MSFSCAERKTCLICGALISDSNPDGLGMECREVYKRARASVFFDDKERSLSFYRLEVDAFMEAFEKTFEGKKFRSKFKKAFYPSVIEQWKTKGFLSRKQLDICKDWLKWDLSCDFKHIFDTYKKGQRAIINQWKPSKSEQEKIINYANKFRYQLKG